VTLRYFLAMLRRGVPPLLAWRLARAFAQMTKAGIRFSLVELDDQASGPEKSGP